jgi:hypothetical protein
MDELKKANGYERTDLISTYPLFFTTSMKSGTLEVMYRDMLGWLPLLNGVPTSQQKKHSPFDIPSKSTLELDAANLEAVFEVIKIPFLSGDKKPSTLSDRR